MVKGKNNMTDLEGLFKNTFEQSEVVPGNQVRNHLMRRLARKEFLHFNPSRFNIYYLGGIIAAGVVGTLLITSGPGKKEISEPAMEQIIVPENTLSGNADTVIIENHKAVNESDVPESDNSGKTNTVKEKPLVKDTMEDNKSGKIENIRQSKL